MDTYTLNVHIDDTQLETLKTDGYNLILAKNVNGAYKVIWESRPSTEYDNTNVFQWTEEFEVFSVNEFDAGALVKAQSEAMPIAYGETCELDEAGVMNSATGTPDDSGTFTVHDSAGQTCIGVNCKLGNEFRPIFVTPRPIIDGDVQFEPKVAVKVWFATGVETSTMIEHADSNALEVIYKGKTTINVGYEGDKPGKGKWIITK